MRRYCRIHGEYSEYYDGCPECKDAEERAEERARETEERAEDRARDAEERAEERAQEVIYKRANPGDHECPACKYITLRRNASRCPICHISIEEQYWDAVRQAEEKAAEAKRIAQEAKKAADAQARAKAEAERQRAEAQQREDAANLKAKKDKELAIRRMTWISVTALGIIVVGARSLLISHSATREAERDLQKDQRLQQELKSALSKAQVVTGRPGETVAFFAPVNGEFVKVLGPCKWRTTGHIYIRTPGNYMVSDMPVLEKPEQLQRELKELRQMGELGSWLAFQAAGDSPVKVNVTFYK